MAARNHILKVRKPHDNMLDAMIKKGFLRFDSNNLGTSLYFMKMNKANGRRLFNIQRERLDTFIMAPKPGNKLRKTNLGGRRHSIYEI